MNSPHDAGVPSSDDAALARAFDYPYQRCEGSFVYIPGGGTQDWHSGGESLDGRHPVLAIGSNAARVQLERKFAGQDAPVPVSSATLRDHEVVYGARLSLYGAAPASLCRSPGTKVAVHVTFLTGAQLETMDNSEGVGEHPPRYRRAMVPAQYVDCGFPLELPSQVYVADRGNLSLDGHMVALDAFPAAGRTLPSMTEREVLEAIASRFQQTVESLVSLVTADMDFRAHVLEVLASEAHPVETGAP